MKTIKKLACLVLLLSGLGHTVFANEIDNLKKQVVIEQRKIDDFTARIKKLEKSKTKLSGLDKEKISGWGRKIIIAKAIVQVLEQQIKQLEQSAE